MNGENIEKLGKWKLEKEFDEVGFSHLIYL